MHHRRNNYGGGIGGGGGPMDDNSTSDSSSSTGFFSPREGRAVSLVNAFSPTPTNGNGNSIGNDTPAAAAAATATLTGNNNSNNHFFHGNSNKNSNDDAAASSTTDNTTTTDNALLPRLQDTSWLGANVSAIYEEGDDDRQDQDQNQFQDDENENDDNNNNAAHDFEQILDDGHRHGHGHGYHNHHEQTTAADAAAAAAAGVGGRGRSFFGLRVRNANNGNNGSHSSSFFGGLRRAISTTTRNNGDTEATEQTTLLFGRTGRHRTAQSETVVRDGRDLSSNMFPLQRSVISQQPLQQQHFSSSTRRHYNLDGSRGGVGGFVGIGFNEGPQLQGYPVPLEEDHQYDTYYDNNNNGGTVAAANFDNNRQQYYDGSSIGYNINNYNNNDYNYSYHYGDNDRNSKFNCSHMMYILRRIFLSRYAWRIPSVSSGLFLFCVALHDLFLKYISYRRDVEPPYSLAWTWPSGAPSALSMLRFGAFSTERVMMGTTTTNDGGVGGSSEYWRCFTSLIWSTSSFVEWLVILAVWFVLEKALQTRVGAEERMKYNNHRREQNQQHTAAAAIPGNDISQPFSSFHATSFQPPLAASSPPLTMSSTANMLSTDYTIMSSLDIVWWLWPLLYVLSALTGQLWVLSFGRGGGRGGSYSVDSAAYGQYFRDANDNDININIYSNSNVTDNVVGCVSWGTAGVACGIGVIWPSQRSRLFVLVILLVILSQLDQSTNAPSSVFGIVGASFWGWSLCGSVGFLLSSLASSSPSPKSASRGKRWAAQKSKDYYTENSFHQDDVHKSLMHPGIVSSNSILHTLGGILSILGLISIWFLPIFNMLWYHHHDYGYNITTTKTAASR